VSGAEGEAGGDDSRGSAVAMAITLNGERREVAAGSSLLELLAGLGLDPRAVAVERNGEVLPRARIAEVTLLDGDRLEIVRFVQGGLATCSSQPCTSTMT
jgi:sulfur carrier protein